MAPATGLFWEEFEAGREWRTGEREIGRTDLEACNAVSGDRNPLHRDDDYARAAGFAGVIAPGVLGLAVTTGLINQLGLTAGTLVAFVGVRWRFEEPLYPGVRVWVQVRARRRRVTKRPDRGVVVLAVSLRNEAGVVLQRGELTFLVRRRPSETAGITE